MLNSLVNKQKKTTETRIPPSQEDKGIEKIIIEENAILKIILTDPLKIRGVPSLGQHFLAYSYVNYYLSL